MYLARSIVTSYLKNTLMDYRAEDLELEFCKATELSVWMTTIARWTTSGVQQRLNN